MKLPASFDMTESFGKVSWSVRGIYDGYAGRYDMNPSTMYELPPSSVYPDLVRLAGDPEPLVRLAQEKLEAGKPVEALHFTDVVLAYDPNNMPRWPPGLRHWRTCESTVKTTLKLATWITESTPPKRN
jgi:alkyl sulfatase BDS1-like metallo-beta-lactamase superfamily hydrolase